MTQVPTDRNQALRDAAQKALNYIENSESELGITLSSGDALRAALAMQEPASEPGRFDSPLSDDCFGCENASDDVCCGKLDMPASEPAPASAPSELRDLALGDTYLEAGADFHTSGINVGKHGNRIQCYGRKPEDAEALRDEVWRVLTAPASAPSCCGVLRQVRGALILDAMVDDAGEFFGTTQVALEAINEALCDDEGCPHHSTRHVCVARPAPFEICIDCITTIGCKRESRCKWPGHILPASEPAPASAPSEEVIEAMARAMLPLGEKHFPWENHVEGTKEKYRRFAQAAYATIPASAPSCCGAALEKATAALKLIASQNERPSNSPDPMHEHYLRRVLIEFAKRGLEAPARAQPCQCGELREALEDIRGRVQDVWDDMISADTALVDIHSLAATAPRSGESK